MTRQDGVRGQGRDDDAAVGRDALLEEVYDELRRLAGEHLRHERPGHTLQATALAHEAWMRLARAENAWDTSRGYFLGAASHVIRRVLIDHARGRGTAKRGGAWQRLDWDDALVARDGEVDLLALDEALDELTRNRPRQADVVVMRFFGGLKGEEIAEVLGVSDRTVDNDWRFARAWLYRRLGGAGAA